MLWTNLHRRNSVVCEVSIYSSQSSNSKIRPVSSTECYVGLNDDIAMIYFLVTLQPWPPFAAWGTHVGGGTCIYVCIYNFKQN